MTDTVASCKMEPVMKSLANRLKLAYSVITMLILPRRTKASHYLKPSRYTLRRAVIDAGVESNKPRRPANSRHAAIQVQRSAPSRTRSSSNNRRKMSVPVALYRPIDIGQSTFLWTSYFRR